MKKRIYKFILKNAALQSRRSEIEWFLQIFCNLFCGFFFKDTYLNLFHSFEYFFFFDYIDMKQIKYEYLYTYVYDLWWF